MPAQKGATSNPFEALSLDVETSSPHVSDKTGIPVLSRRQQKKAAQADKAKADLAKQQAVAAAAAPSSKTAIEAIAEKPLGWKASLTIAQVKALDAEEKAEKHAELHPAKTKKTSGMTAHAKGTGKEEIQNKRSRFGPGAPSGCGLKGIR